MTALLRDKLNGLFESEKNEFRNAHGPLDWGRWDRFSREAKSLGAPGVRPVWEYGCRGEQFWSASVGPRPSICMSYRLPVRALPLSDSNLSGMPSVSESGILDRTDFSNSRQILGHQLMSRDQPRVCFSSVPQNPLSSRAGISGRGGCQASSNLILLWRQQHVSCAHRRLNL